MSDPLQDRIAPEPPEIGREKKYDTHDTSTESMMWHKDWQDRWKAYNLKHPQIDWRLINDFKPDEDSQIYFKGKVKSFTFKKRNYYLYLNQDIEWCYAKEYEEAEAIKKSIRPFGDFKEIPPPFTSTNLVREWIDTNRGLDLTYNLGNHKCYEIYHNNDFIFKVHASHAEKTIKSILETLSK